jgi:hypothetical protein
VIPARRPIEVEQNTGESLELLRAFSWRYQMAKRWHFVRILGTLLLAAAAPVVTFWIPSATDAVAALAGVWILVARVALSSAENRDLRRGAIIQELFDTRLFRLGWNASLVGVTPAPEDISDAASRVRDDSSLRNWYASTGNARWPLDVLLCQRSSAAWGRRAHGAYAYTILGIGLAWLVAGVIMGVVAHLSLADYLVKIFLPSQPAFLDTADLFLSHLNRSHDKERLEHNIDELFATGAIDLSRVSAEDCRRIQDNAFQLRRDGPQVAEWFYRLRRGRDERAMRAAVARLLDRVSPGARDTEHP